MLFGVGESGLFNSLFQLSLNRDRLVGTNQSESRKSHIPPTNKEYLSLITQHASNSVLLSARD